MARLYGTGSLWLRKSKKHPKGEYWLRFRDGAGRQRTEKPISATVTVSLGFRKSELQNLLCLQLVDGWLRLFAGATKNGKARTVKLPDDVHTGARGRG